MKSKVILIYFLLIMSGCSNTESAKVKLDRNSCSIGTFGVKLSELLDVKVELTDNSSYHITILHSHLDNSKALLITQLGIAPDVEERLYSSPYGQTVWSELNVSHTYRILASGSIYIPVLTYSLDRLDIGSGLDGESPYEYFKEVYANKIIENDIRSFDDETTGKLNDMRVLSFRLCGDYVGEVWFAIKNSEQGSISEQEPNSRLISIYKQAQGDAIGKEVKGRDGHFAVTVENIVQVEDPNGSNSGTRYRTVFCSDGTTRLLIEKNIQNSSSDICIILNDTQDEVCAPGDSWSVKTAAEKLCRS